MRAMLGMKKFDIAELRAAYEGNDLDSDHAAIEPPRRLVRASAGDARLDQPAFHR